MTTLPVRGAVAALGLTAACLLSASAPAQTSFPFPLAPAGLDTGTGLPRLVSDRALLPELAAAPSVRLTGLTLGDGRTVDLALERIDLARLEFGFQVDGLPAPGLLDGLDLSVFRGEVVGEPGSDVLLSFSQRGSRGWIASGGDVHHLMPQPGPGGWADDHALLVRESELESMGSRLDAFCGTTQLDPITTRDAVPTAAPEPSAGSYLGGCSFWECTMAIETDWQLFQVFNDLGAETAYLTTLLAAVSARYEEQIDTVLSFPYVQFYTSASDPWSTPESGGSMLDMLSEFESAWAGAVPAGAVLGHFVSGAPLGGGVAYLGALCDTSHTFSFAVSGNIDGQVPFPIAVGPLNWDFMVFAHETGHNFNSPHTHDYSPPIDECALGTCTSTGTIMSYCHQCPGGLSNITTFFNEPTVTGVMKAHAGNCLPFFAPLVADAGAQPTLLAPGVAVPLQVELLGTPVGTVDLNWRASPGDGFSAIAMSPLGGGLYGADLPAMACGDQAEWFFSVDDASCGAYVTATFQAEVGAQTTLLADDFESGSTWTVGAAGDDATTGVWVLGDPNGTAAQPEDDQTAGGTDCWFTGQGGVGGGIGDNDVDGGKTTLVGSAIDLSSGDARIGYWRWYSNDAGSSPNADVFVVEVSNGGAWQTVETVGPSGAGTSGGWIWHDFQVSDFVTPNSSVQVRFIASDEGSGSIVEAAIDGLEVFRVDCGEVCQPSLGFGGPGSATLTLCGGDLSTGTSADLTLSGATPGGTAFLFAGLVNGPTPVKGGVLVPVPWLLDSVLPINGAGEVDFPVPGGNGPLSVYAQYVYTDGAQPQGYGFSNAIAASFLP